LRYAHTAAEVADMNDVEALRKIVSVLLEQELAGGVSGAVE
jgi:putative aminopeptidase FrvX